MLREVVARTSATQPIDVHLREFLDEFYVEPSKAERQRMLEDEPAPTGNSRADAYLAAVAEHLAFRYGLDVPAWALSESRFLHTPHFPAGLESLKAITLVESPTAFRRRLIFVDRDPLSRPRRQGPNADDPC
jgi:hypothetical protein